jgi:hypothetical protein
MKKIIVAFDNSHYSEGAMQFVLRLHQQQPVSLTGVFLPPMDYVEIWGKTAGALAGGLFVPVQEEHVKAVRSNISQFEAFCQQHYIRYTISKDFFDYTLHDLRGETRYADLLVIGSEAFYSEVSTDSINTYLQDTLHHAECPVVLVPEQFVWPHTNILSFDGSASSAFAIKQFSYLFPELCDRKTLVVYVDEDPDATMPAEQKVKDLVCRHFDQCAYLTLHMDSHQYLQSWIREQRGGFLVCGSFGRSTASQFFKRSFMYEAVMNHQLPVFIAHK